VKRDRAHGCALLQCRPEAEPRRTDGVAHFHLKMLYGLGGFSGSGAGRSLRGLGGGGEGYSSCSIGSARIGMTGALGSG
jgi:hypothetical protein